MTVWAIAAFVLCLGDVIAVAVATSGLKDVRLAVREAVREVAVRPEPLPRPVPMPELYTGRHRSTVHIGGTR